MENKHKQFNPFDKVLVRVSASNRWDCSFYSYYNDKDNEYPHKTFHYCLKDENILPYKGNEHLVGTTDEPEEIILEKGEYILASDFIHPLETGFGEIGKFVDIENEGFIKTAYNNSNLNYIFALRLSDSLNANDTKDRKSKILCVKNGKIVRYKK